ncbi:MAG: methylmalonyl Co-A mutase-associated GTPase MeaB [Candidatus Marinimicrobia bacterium]|nr:methylmalonyl Co-A mutase-associated GTPase MeaB [Candidatus Neomarinimicrobiota bacterium]
MSSFNISSNSLKENCNLSRAITIVENKLDGYSELLSNIYHLRKNIQKIGITGPPGAGKSTITNSLCKDLLKEDQRIAIISVDPTSPFNGGAILGDRIRMKDIHDLDNVYIRSLGSRGSAGGLSETIDEIIILLEAAGFDRLIIETVGVGQVELDVINFCDTIVLCLTPESGDDIQMMKSGLLECADIISINKSDRPGSKKINIFLNQLFDISQKLRKPPVLNLVALKNKGIDELALEIKNHYLFLKSTNAEIKRDIERYKKLAFNSIKNNLSNEFLNEKRMSFINKEAKKENIKRISPFKIFKKLPK